MKIIKSIVLAFLSVIYSWIFLIDLVQITPNKYVGWGTMVASFVINVGISFFLFSKAIDFIQKSYQGKQRFFLARVFAIWAFVEWVVAWMAYFVWIGPEGSIDSVSPYASLTPIVSGTPVIFLARVFGFHGLSALIVTIAVALSLKRYRNVGYGLLSFAIISTIFCRWFWKVPNGEDLTVTVTAEKLQQEQPIDTQADLVVLPEYGLDSFEEKGTRVKSGNNSEFIGSRQDRFEDLKVKNQFVHGAVDNGIIETYEKSRLVPAGEYLPWLVDVPLKVFRQYNTVQTFETVRAVEKGDQPLEPIQLKSGVVVGSAVCSSIINTEDYRKLTKVGAMVLTNSASLGIFGGSSVYKFLHMGMARFHAVANARTFVQSTLDFPAFVFDHNGKKLVEIQPVSYEDVSITSNTKKTLYTIVGDWAVWLGLVYLTTITSHFLRFKWVAKKT